jgi:hypothetical protein
MEEAAQILEVETFIPMVLQSSQVRGGRGVIWGGSGRSQKNMLACKVVVWFIYSPH